MLVHTARDALSRAVKEIKSCNSEHNAYRRLYFIAFCEFSAVRKSGGKNYHRTKDLCLLSIPAAKNFMLLEKVVDSSDDVSSDDDSSVDDKIRIQSGTIPLMTTNVEFENGVCNGGTLVRLYLNLHFANI